VRFRFTHLHVLTTRNSPLATNCDDRVRDRLRDIYTTQFVIPSFTHWHILSTFCSPLIFCHIIWLYVWLWRMKYKLHYYNVTYLLRAAHGAKMAEIGTYSRQSARHYIFFWPCYRATCLTFENDILTALFKYHVPIDWFWDPIFRTKCEFVEEHTLLESQSYRVITEQSWYKLLRYEIVNSAIKISLLRAAHGAKMAEIDTYSQQSARHYFLAMLCDYTSDFCEWCNCCARPMARKWQKLQSQLAEIRLLYGMTKELLWGGYH